MPKFQQHNGVPSRSANGACFACRQSKKGTYVRTHIDIEFQSGEGSSRRSRDGEVVYCRGCAEAIGHAVGMATARSNEATKAENARVRDENKELRARVEELEKLESAVAAVRQTATEPVSVPA